MASGIDVESQNQQQSSSEQQKAAAAGPSRSQLVQRLLDASANLPQFVHDLIQTQAVTVAGTEAAAFLIERGAAPPAEGAEGDAQSDAEKAAAAAQFGLRPIAHIRPDESGPEIRAAALEAFKEIVKPCIQQGKDGAFEVGPANQQAESQFCLVTLLRNEGTVVAASSVITRARDLDRARQRLMSMQLVAGYFELFTLRRTSEQSRVVAQSHQHVLQLATSVATAEGFESAAMNLCNELATRSGAVRVSLGWVKGRNIKVKALSHTEQFDKKQELVVQLEKAMEECIDQDQVVQFDPSPNGINSENVTRAHQALSRAQGGHAVLSLPLRRREEVLGVVTLEFLPTQPLAPQVAQGLGVAVELLAPQLYDRFQNDRWLITKTGIATRELAKKAIGPKHMLAKLIIATSIIGLLVICDWVPLVDLRWMFKVTAPFQFVPQVKQVVSAPFEGQINEIGQINGERVRPGVVVKEGDVLLKLDTKELQTKLWGVLNKVRGLKGQVRKAQEEDKATEEQIYQAQLQEAESERDLLEYQIDRAVRRRGAQGRAGRQDQRAGEGRRRAARGRAAPRPEGRAERQRARRAVPEGRPRRKEPAGARRQEAERHAGHHQQPDAEVRVQDRPDRPHGRGEGRGQRLQGLRDPRRPQPARVAPRHAGRGPYRRREEATALGLDPPVDRLRAAETVVAVLSRH